MKFKNQEQKTLQGLKNVLDRSKSRGRGDENVNMNANNAGSINLNNQKPPRTT
jgi:hypothetical protein